MIVHSMHLLRRQVPLERDINIAVNGCSEFATSTQKGPFMAMLISHSRGTYLIRALPSSGVSYVHELTGYGHIEDHLLLKVGDSHYACTPHLQVRTSPHSSSEKTFFAACGTHVEKAPSLD